MSDIISVMLSANALVNISAIATAIKCDPALCEWAGHSTIDLYRKAGEWGVVVTTEEALLEQALAAHGEDWPGVFVYEVTEEVGRLIRQSLIQANTPEDEQVREWVRSTIREFCTPEWLPPVFETYKELSHTA